MNYRAAGDASRDARTDIHVKQIYVKNLKTNANDSIQPKLPPYKRDHNK